MNYQKIYDSLVERARSRELSPSCYYEKHHVTPKCLGGEDTPDNIVSLTAEEHFLAHQILVKLHPTHYGICFAAFRMTTHTHGGRTNNKLYGWLRKRLAQNVPKRGPMSQETKDKLSMAKRGAKWSQATRDKMSTYYSTRVMSEREKSNRIIASTGRKHSEETKQKIADSKIGKTRSDDFKLKMSEYWKNRDVSWLHTPEVAEKISESLKGKPKTAEHRRKLAEANIGKTASQSSRQRMSEARAGVPKSDTHNASVSRAKTGTKKVEISAGVYKMLNPAQLTHFLTTGEYLTLKDSRRLNESVSG